VRDAQEKSPNPGSVRVRYYRLVMLVAMSSLAIMELEPSFVADDSAVGLDFSESSIVAPPSRPNSEESALTYASLLHRPLRTSERDALDSIARSNRKKSPDLPVFVRFGTGPLLSLYRSALRVVSPSLRLKNDASWQECFDWRWRRFFGSNGFELVIL